MIGRLLQRASELLALLGGLLLVAAALMTVASIVGRNGLDRPLVGDIELMQVACAVLIALFLPYCQWQAAHVRVDFFTQRAGPRLRALLDRAAHGAAGGVLLLLAWRAAVGVADMYAAGETTMLLGFPQWLTYLALVPGLALAAAIAFHQACTRAEEAEHPPPPAGPGPAA